MGKFLAIDINFPLAPPLFMDKTILFIQETKFQYWSNIQLGDSLPPLNSRPICDIVKLGDEMSGLTHYFSMMWVGWRSCRASNSIIVLNYRFLSLV